MATTNDLRKWPLLVLALAPLAAPATGRLEVTGAWIRSAPPGAMMLAGYAGLHNGGDAPVVIRGASSDAFAAVSLHESITSGGVERMRALGEITLAPDASVALVPGGKHLMLMQPSSPLRTGTTVKIHFDTDGATGIDADFIVREDAPPAH